MATQEPIIRQSMGCGFLPPVDDVCVWTPPTWDASPSVCLGYCTSMPETIDVARAYHHWKVGALRERCDGTDPPRPLLDGVEALNAEVVRCEAHVMDERARKKGGAG